ncbi:ATP-binding protein [[Limnothrix rosea] IAM M-220]|uniref:ATP-binding protein n=1 Tax=[Limnothrix rosea] IAM M-220 TaxID=454133 RepID=UPI00095A8D83|nr:ATP-binding protein [[Limnothrix rosea] IAM M-220]OKH19586.1 hypothetical protein NIES208_01935 [[Limnothrix rosea] IAM M-220]
MTESPTTTEKLRHIESFDTLPQVIRRILCFATDQAVLDQLQIVISAIEGLEVYGCLDFAGAIAHLEREHFDCALVVATQIVDWQKLLQCRAQTLPTIALTTDTDPCQFEYYLGLGVTDYLAIETLTVQQLRHSLFHVVRLKQLQRKNRELNQALQKTDERYRLTLDVSKDGIWDWTITNQEIESNDRLWEMLGLNASSSPLNFEQFKTLIHPDDYPSTKTAFKAHLYEDKDFSVEVRLRHKDGEYRDFWIRGQLQRSSLHHEPRMCGLMTDITERKRNDRRNRFLSQASSLLNASLDCQATLENLAWLAVPRIADWCILEIQVEQTGDRPVVASHRDPAREPLVQQFFETLTQVSPAPTNPQYAYQLSPEQKQNLSHQYGWSSALLDQLELHSYIWIPLQVGQRPLGSIFFAWEESHRSCTSEDLALLQELAYRATWSIENARLYDERQAVYQDLQGAIAQLTTQQKRLTTLKHLTTLTNRRLTNIPELLQGIVHQICKDVSVAQVCAIALHTPEQGDNFFIVTDQQHPEAAKFEEMLQQDQNWLRHVYQTGQPQLQNFDLKAPAPCSLAAVAIESVSSGRLGILIVGNWQVAQAFSTEDCSFLSAVGEEAAVAIDNARLIKTLEQQNQELIETSRVKDLFLATVSHELRTPMNAILGFSQVLLNQRKSFLGGSEQQILRRILSNGRSLMALINDILDFSQMKLTELKLMPSTFDLESLTKDIVDELQSLAEEKQLHFKLTSHLEDSSVTHDQKRIRQVIVNLVANALSFTQQGTVAITLEEQLEAKTVTITVRDTGIGIAPENLEHIFSEFWQVQQDMHLSKSGTGLGLAITYKLVQRMKGTIDVESAIGKGSCFKVTLPRSLNSSPPVNLVV